MRLAILFASSFLALSVPIALADEALTILGQKLVTKDLSDVEEVLELNGKRLHQNTHVRLGERYELSGGALAVMGTSSPGGNACSGAPFVLLIKPDGTSRFDGPIETCYAIEALKEGDRIVFQEPRVAGSASQKWIWSQTSGFEAQADVAFAPDEGTTWAGLRGAKLEFFSDIFKNAEVLGDVKALLGADYEPISEIFGGPGSGEWKGDHYVASVCRAHACGEEALFLMLNAKEQKIYSAWKPSDKPIKVYPSPVKSWPKAARAELKDWAKNW